MKHNDGYTEHIQVVCPKCKTILMQCVDCEIKEPRKTKYTPCTEMIRQDTCIGAI